MGARRGRTTELTKKEIERYYFDEFCNDYLLPSGKISHKDKPDFRLELGGGRKIGIEMTRFYLEDGELIESEQSQRVLRGEIIFDAQQDYQRKNNRKVELSISFNELSRVRARRKGLVNELASLAGRLIKENKTKEIRRYEFETIPEIFFLYLNEKEDEDAKWNDLKVYTGTVMSRDKLVEIVRGKEKDSKEYEKCESYWLLVTVDSFDPAQDQEIQIDNFEKIESNIFEKIFVYNPIFGHILEAK